MTSESRENYDLKRISEREIIEHLSQTTSEISNGTIDKQTGESQIQMLQQLLDSRNQCF